MPNVVSNTTPILSLLKINKLELLKELYGKIIIPRAVFDEIESGKLKPYYSDMSVLDWVEVRQVKDLMAVDYLLTLDRGEAEVLILAGEIKVNLVILDEIMGRKYAKQFNLKLTGTMGVLLRAKENGLLHSVKDLLAELSEKGTWLNPKLITKVLKLAKED